MSGGARRGRPLRRAALFLWALFITFLVFPDVSSLVFQVFRCECFGDGADADPARRLLAAVHGGRLPRRGEATPEYTEASNSAWIVIGVYAIGVPCAYAALLLAARRAIIEGRSTPLADALAFLHDGYRPGVFWWEMASVALKLTVVGFATLIFPGTPLQLIVVLLILIAYQLVLTRVQPFASAEATFSPKRSTSC